MNFDFIIFKLLPKAYLSKAFGIFTRIEQPRWFVQLVLKIYCSIYKPDLSEATKSIAYYASLSDFFVRDVRRTIEDGFISPADGVLRANGCVEESNKYLIKGISYSLPGLLRNDELTSSFHKGSYLNIYLSPKDYHQVHVPFDCELIKTVEISGRLYPVNDRTLGWGIDIYTENARKLYFLKTERCLYCLIMVTAFNVGEVVDAFTNGQTVFKKGDKISKFMLGSSVVLLSEQQDLAKLKISELSQVKMGNSI